jgi:predicted unusual protein kinase regulating ubiquinone biosynthesis (AarF/ABC1/UbiB family)
MESFVSQIVRKTEAEAIYTRERQRMNRERFRAYYADFYTACGRRDYHRVSEVVQDATMITSDTVRLVRRMREIRTRQRALASPVGFVGLPVPPPTGDGISSD